MKLTYVEFKKEGFVNIFEDGKFIMCVKNTLTTLENLNKASKLLESSEDIKIEFNINRDFEIKGGAVRNTNDNKKAIYKDVEGKYYFIYTYRALEDVEEIATDFVSHSWDREYLPNYTTEAIIHKVIRTTKQILKDNEFEYSYTCKTYMKDGSVLDMLPENCELDLTFNKVILTKKYDYSNVTDGMFPHWEADGFDE